MSLPFSLLPTNVNNPTPIWDGNEFQIGSESVKVLEYSQNNQGWNDELTHFHEESVGDQHFIDCASREHAINELKKCLPNEGATILEVGCSSGYLIKKIKHVFPKAMVMGADIVSEPLQRLAETMAGVPFFRFDLTQCPLPDDCIDAIVILNVLEHIEDDACALQQMYRILKPGGTLIIEVPSGPNLYDIYDKMMMHYRRYSLSNLCQLVKQSGFNVLKQSHLGFFLFPGFWLVKQRNKRLFKNSDFVQRVSVQNNIKQTGDSKLLHAVMRLELIIGRKMSFPRGIRCLVRCQKPR